MRRIVFALAACVVGCSQPKKMEVPAPVSKPAEVLDDVGHGRYLATIGACLECHTPRLATDDNALDESKLMAGGIPFEGPWGTVHSANVSAVAAAYEAPLLEAAIRGRLSFKFQMPTDLYASMAADDMRDLVAFIRSLKPVDEAPPVNTLHLDYRPPPPLAGEAPPEHAPQGVTVERGEYLATIAICKDCHSPRNADGTYDQAHRMAGGGLGIRVGDRTLLPANLTPDVETGLGGWSDDQIITAFRTGVAKDGRKLHPAMPWRVAYAQMKDDDARAIVKWLRSLPPVRHSIPANGPYVEGAPLRCCFAGPVIP